LTGKPRWYGRNEPGSSEIAARTVALLILVSRRASNFLMDFKCKRYAKVYFDRVTIELSRSESPLFHGI
jgi:hypothetical protein